MVMGFLRRVRRTVGGLADDLGLDEALDAARTVLSRVRGAAASVGGLAEDVSPGLALTGPTTAGLAALVDPDVRRAVRQDLSVLRQGNAVQRALALLNLPAEPLRQPVGRAIADTLDIDRREGETPQQAISRAVAGQTGGRRLLARAGEIAYLTGTDPITILLGILSGGVGGAAVAGAKGAAGGAALSTLARVGAREAGQVALTAALGAAGEEAGAAAAGRLGLSEDAGRLVGGLAAPVAGSVAVRRLAAGRLGQPSAPVLAAAPGSGAGAGAGAPPPSAPTSPTAPPPPPPTPRPAPGSLARALGTPQGRAAVGAGLGALAGADVGRGGGGGGEGGGDVDVGDILAGALVGAGLGAAAGAAAPAAARGATRLLYPAAAAGPEVKRTWQLLSAHDRARQAVAAVEAQLAADAVRDPAAVLAREIAAGRVVETDARRQAVDALRAKAARTAARAAARTAAEDAGLSPDAAKAVATAAARVAVPPTPSATAAAASASAPSAAGGVPAVPAPAWAWGRFARPSGPSGTSGTAAPVGGAGPRTSVDVVVQAVQAAGVADPVRARAVAEAVVDAAGAAAAARAAAVDAVRLSVPVIREDPTGFILSAKAIGALVRLDRAYAAEGQRALAAGLLTPDQLVDRYSPHFWQSKAAAGGRLGSPTMVVGQPMFARKRSYPTILAGVAAGETPTTLDPVELLAGRVRLRVQAEADRELLTGLARERDWWRTKPTPGYVPLRDVLIIGDGKVRDQITQLLGVKRTATLFIREDVGRTLRSAFAPAPSGPVWRVVEQVLHAPRYLSLGLDISNILRITPGVLLSAFGVAGKRGAADVARGVRESLTEASFHRLLRTADVVDANGRLLRPGYATAARYVDGLMPGGVRPDLAALGRDVAEEAARRTWAERIPVLSSAIDRLERWQFGRLAPALTYQATAAMYERMRRMPQYAHLADEELLLHIGRMVSPLTVGVSRTAAGTSRAHELALRTFLISPSWFRGQLATLAGVGRPGVEGMVARRFWTATLATMGAVSVGMSWLLDGDWSVDALLRLADPRRPDSVTNPDSPHFLMVKLPGDGGWVAPWGPVRSELRAIGKGMAAVARRAGTPEPTLWYVPSVAAAVLSPAAVEPLFDWAMAKVNVPLQQAQQQLSNRDFRGRPITQADEPLAQLLDRLTYGAAAMAPSSLSAFLTGSGESVQPDVELSGRRLLQAAASFAGVGYAPPGADPAWVKDRVAAFVRDQGEWPGDDPVRAFRQLPLSPLAKQRFLAQNPDVADYLERKRQERQKEERPPTDEVVGAYLRLSGQARADRDRDLRAAGERLTRGEIGGDQYRQAVREAWDAYFTTLRTASGVWFGTDDLDAVQRRIDAALARRGRGRGRDREAGMTDLDRLYEQYEAIAVPEDGTPEEVEAALAARRRFLQEHPELLPVLVDLARGRGGEAYARYVAAQQVAGQLAEMPRYLGMDAAQARAGGRLVARARDMASMGLAPDPLVALLIIGGNDPALPAALRILYRAVVPNPERRLFQQQHAAELAPFYSRLLLSDVEAAIQAGLALAPGFP